MRWMKCLAGCLIVFCAIGCHSTKSTRISPDADDKLGGTGIDSADVRTVAQKMARSLLGVPAIANAQRPPRVALLPVRNRTRFRIDSDILTTKIRDEIMMHTQGKMIFLARTRVDEIMQEREAKRAGRTTASKLSKLSGADYFLTGELRSISKSNSKRVSDYIVYSFQLIDTETSDILWAQSYDVKKQGKWGTVYQ